MFKYKSPLSRILDGTDTSIESKNNELGDGIMVVTDTDLMADAAVFEDQKEACDIAAGPAASHSAGLYSERPQSETTSNQLDEDKILSPANSTTSEDVFLVTDIERASGSASATGPEEANDTEISPARRNKRVKTTFIGFGNQDDPVQDLMGRVPQAKINAAQVSFPVGWFVITGGPGRGTSVTLTGGLMQIGRNDDQAIQLDFGDNGISRDNHAVIAYDPEHRKCYLGHGGKANLVRLNGGPVLSTTPLATGDEIRISETTMQFVAFCDEEFDWQDS